MELFTTFLYLTLLAVAFAAEDVSAPADCPVKAGHGSYSYDPTSSNGPAHWGTIHGNEMCGVGKAQSPIDLPTKVTYAPNSLAPVPYHLGGMMALTPNSYNWALNCEKEGTCGSTTFAGKNFSVINIHFHSPSEHILNGTQYPLEAHVVHASLDGQLVVLSTLFQYLPEDSFYSKICAEKPMDCGTNSLLTSIFTNIESKKETFYVNIGSIINRPLGYCAYIGSLTTPPCSEGVTWLVANHVEYVHPRQVDKFLVSAGATYDKNNRPSQPLNGRDIVCYVL